MSRHTESYVFAWNDADLAASIVEAVATVTDRDPLALASLYDVVDAEALATLVDDGDVESVAEAGGVLGGVGTVVGTAADEDCRVAGHAPAPGGGTVGVRCGRPLPAGRELAVTAGTTATAPGPTGYSTRFDSTKSQSTFQPMPGSWGR